MTRRRFLGLAPLTAAFVVGAGMGVGGLYMMGMGGSEADASTRPPAEAARGTIDWALAMVDAPAAEFLAAAGELERVRMNSADDPRLVPVFARLLDVALVETPPTADEAGAIAVRCLYRLGADQRVEVRRKRILDHAARPNTRSEFERLRGR